MSEVTLSRSLTVICQDVWSLQHCAITDMIKNLKKPKKKNNNNKKRSNMC